MHCVRSTWIVLYHIKIFSSVCFDFTVIANRTSVLSVTEFLCRCDQTKRLEKQKSMHSKGTSVAKRHYQRHIVNYVQNNVQGVRKKCCFSYVYLLGINIWFFQ